MESSLAISVQNACKSYGGKEVLKNLSMHVPKGVIYGLLGASGCGKTTLLSCVVGRKKLNSGDICILGGHPGTDESGVPGPRVGYMPQEIALVGEFTVKDAIYYFGRILNMADKLISERFYKLCNLLDLPPADRYLKNCSGGQQRRVSFAAAMVHSPELLILDEPTVGLDPVLRDRLWNHLVEITKTEKTTVIITTHYIEEARQSNVIGLMRDGKLLAQESPQRLLQIFQTDYLEDVFLALSKKQEEGILNETPFNRFENIQNCNPLQNSSTDISLASFNENQGSVEVLTQNHKPRKSKKTHRTLLNGNRIRALMDKNWKQFYRNIAGMIFLLLVPIAEIIFFLVAIGGDPKGINLAIINDEGHSAFCPNFTTNGTAIPYSFSSCHFYNFGCRFINTLNDPMINKVEYNSFEKAINASKHGDVIGVLYIPNNFTESLEERIEQGKNAELEILDFSQIKVWLDMSNRQIGVTIKYKLYEIFRDYQEKILEDCKLSPKMTKVIDFKHIYGKENETFTIFMTPGVVLTIMFFIAALMTSSIIITDRLEGVWERSTIAGVTSLEITLTHLLLQACIVVIHTLELMIITFLLFKTEVIGSIWTLGLLTYLQGIAGMGFGFWISIISSNYNMANIVTTGSFYFMIFICGMMWPLQGMPVVLQYIAKCLPFTVAIDSFRNVMKKGWSITHLEVLNGIGIELLWIISLTVLSIYLLKFKR